MSEEKVKWNDSSRLRELLESVNTDLDTTDNDVISFDVTPIAGPSRPNTSRPALSSQNNRFVQKTSARRPIDWDSDRSDTTIDDSDADKNYVPSSCTDSSSLIKKQTKKCPLKRVNKFAESTPKKRAPLRPKVSKPRPRIIPLAEESDVDEPAPQDYFIYTLFTWFFMVFLMMRLSEGKKMFQGSYYSSKSKFSKRF